MTIKQSLFVFLFIMFYAINPSYALHIGLEHGLGKNNNSYTAYPYTIHSLHIGHKTKINNSDLSLVYTSHLGVLQMFAEDKRPIYYNIDLGIEYVYSNFYHTLGAGLITIPSFPAVHPMTYLTLGKKIHHSDNDHNNANKYYIKITNIHNNLHQEKENKFITSTHITFGISQEI